MNSMKDICYIYNDMIRYNICIKMICINTKSRYNYNPGVLSVCTLSFYNFYFNKKTYCHYYKTQFYG